MEASNYMMNSTEYGADGMKSATMAKLEVGFPGDLFDQIDDLLDFSNDEIGGPIEDDIGGNFEANSSNCCSKAEYLESKPVLETLSSSSLPIDKAHDSSSVELCVPCDDLAELEWLSNFVEDSFMQNETKPLFPADFIEVNQQESYESQGTEKFRSASPTSVLEGSSCSGKVFPMFNPEQPVPGKARSKRKAKAPADNWASRIFSHAPLQDSSQSSSSSVMIDMEEFAPRPPPMMTTMTTGWQDDSEAAPKKLIKPSHGERRRFHDSNNPLQVRKCLHCGIQKTPQWRAGPMGPKTLCNACGVRYKSGRLLPEYRPAASPTFSILKHSNSHKKVLEMRRQREVTVMRHQVASKVEPNYDDYLLNISTDYRHDALRENIYHSMH